MSEMSHRFYNSVVHSVRSIGPDPVEMELVDRELRFEQLSANFEINIMWPNFHIFLFCKYPSHDGCGQPDNRPRGASLEKAGTAKQ